MSTSVFSFDQRRRAMKNYREQLSLNLARMATLAKLDYITLKEFEEGIADLEEDSMKRLEEAVTDQLARQRGAARK